jgi:hypothetical protein
MRINRISDHMDDSPQLAAATPLPGFAICPFASAPQSLMIQLAALQQAYRDQLATAQQRAVQRVLDGAIETVN